MAKEIWHMLKIESLIFQMLRNGLAAADKKCIIFLTHDQLAHRSFGNVILLHRKLTLRFKNNTISKQKTVDITIIFFACPVFCDKTQRQKRSQMIHSELLSDSHDNCCARLDHSSSCNFLPIVFLIANFPRKSVWIF